MTGLEAVLLGLAAWRWTRLVTVDEIARPLRDLARRQAMRNGWAGRAGGTASYLLGCPHCVGVWASAAVVAVWAWTPAWGAPWIVAVVAPAVAAVVSLIASTVPD